MSELIEPPLKETASLLRAAKHARCKDKSALIDKEKDKIVLFNGGIYVLYNYNEHSLTWGVDYYTYKMIAATTDRYDIIISHNTFSIVEPDGRLDLRLSECREQHANHYEYFMKTHVDLTDRSEEEINAVHLGVLAAEIQRKLLDAPSAEQIKGRESQHRGILRTELYRELSKISNHIYYDAKKGKLSTEISFPTITENRITSYGGTPRFAKFPCVDGRVRETFTEYFYYLFEGIFERHADEDAPMWIWARLLEEIRRVFPHLTVECGSLKGLMPQITIRFNIDVSLPKMIQ
jgi:hypothetical protein